MNYTYTPNFAAYYKGKFRAGERDWSEPGDVVIHDDDVTWYIYRGIEDADLPAFFDWASDAFCQRCDEPARLVQGGNGYCVDRRSFEPPPGPADDSDEYQDYLDGPYTQALLAWQQEYRPSNA
jgi:hypothetical protein